MLYVGGMVCDMPMPIVQVAGITLLHYSAFPVRRTIIVIIMYTYPRVRYIIAGNPRVDNMRRNARVVRLTRAVKSLRRSRAVVVSGVV